MSTDPAFPLAGKRVWVAGHRGMVGSALVRRLAREACEVLTTDSDRLDLRRQEATQAWMADARPDAVFIAAARVGGILANESYPGEFLHDNLAIQTNIIEGARRAGVQKLVFLGSSCIYPRLAPQPIVEEALLTGPLETTNEWYAIAKIAGLKLTQAYRRQYGCDFISAMPTNLYGPGDNYDLAASHALPALLRKAHEAKARGERALVVWGSGKPMREFMHVDDCADALVFLMQRYAGESHINVGSGEELSIAALAALVLEVVGLRAEIRYDTSKPDGTPRKRLDSGKLTALGWQSSIRLREGVADAYRWFQEHVVAAGDA
ncbi:MAG TPA: GDP-L-fucose synthase [Caulobacteraceae bacterium]|nr:GDP-L-fucose synthase [Caulobacteraceae bacterium]